MVPEPEHAGPKQESLIQPPGVVQEGSHDMNHTHSTAVHSAPSLSDASEKSVTNPEKDMAGSADIDLEKGSDVTAPPEEPNSPAEKAVDRSLVVFADNDSGNPKNWSVNRRIGITLSLSSMTFVVTFASSIFAVAIEPVSKEYNVGTVVAALGVALFLLGFVLGPVVFGPLSEVYGRRPPLMLGYMAFAIFQVPVAVAQNIETIMLGRFLGGLFASAPLAVIGGCLADLWDPVERTYAVCAFAAGVFCGPVVGPIVGGFVTESELGWRWTAWLTLILAALFGTIGLFAIPETAAQRILQMRAKRLRFETKNWALHAKADENQITLHTICHIYLMRPWVMLVQEPILALLTAYMSYLYGVLYLLFEAFPISFHEERGWSLGISNLPFIAFIVGIFMGTGLMVYSTTKHFKPAFIKHGRAIPEQRLPAMIVGAILLPIGLFWFAWTSFPSVSWVPQVMSVALIGCGMLVTFWQGINFIIDCYGFYSNSAIAVNTFIRSIAGAVFPLFAPIMYHNLGVRYATTVLACICVAFLPAPILFYKYGEKIRAKSKFIIPVE